MVWITSPPREFPPSDDPSCRVMSPQMNAERATSILMEASVAAVTLAPSVRGFGVTFGDAASKMSLALNAKFGEAASFKEKTVIYVEDGIPFQIPTGTGISRCNEIGGRGGRRPQVVYCALETAKKVAYIGKAELLCIIAKKLVVGDGIDAEFLKKIGRAVKSRRIRHVLFATEQSSTAEELQGVKDALGGVSFSYTTFDY